MGSIAEAESKKRQLADIILPALLKKPSSAAMTEDKKVDVLQYQNQRLSQELEFQKEQKSALEQRVSEFLAKQEVYDGTLSVVNRSWEQLIGDLEVLAARANAGSNGLHVPRFSHDDGDLAATTPDGLFLQRLLHGSGCQPSTSDDCQPTVDKALRARRTSTVKVLEVVISAIERERSRNDELAAAIRSKLSGDDAGQLLRTEDEHLRKEVSELRARIDTLHVQERELSGEVAALQDLRLKDQQNMQRLQGELDQATSALETAKRKPREKDLGPGPPPPSATPPSSGKESSDKPSKDAERLAKRVKELEAALVEAETLSASRLRELEFLLQEKLGLARQLQELEAMLKSDQHVMSTRPYMALTERLNRCYSDLEESRENIKILLNHRDLAVIKERDLIFKAEAGETTRRALVMADQRCQELEEKLQQRTIERDTLERRLEQEAQSAGRKESLAEVRSLVRTIEKEKDMLQAQLAKYKALAEEVPSLRAQTQSQAVILERKTAEFERLLKESRSRLAELKESREQAKAQKFTEMELRQFVEMFEHASTDPRDVTEVRKAERRALVEVEKLRRELDENELELRVKVAIEAEAACQQRLAAAEADIARLRQLVGHSERELAELKQALEAKNEEGDAYINEIETIGNTYEEMQAQNKRLLQLVGDKDEQHTQLMAENMKAKQLHSSIVAEKENMATHMEHAKAAADLQKQKVAGLEEQLKESVEQLAKAMEEAAQYRVALDSQKRLARDADLAAQQLREEVQQVERERDAKLSELAEKVAELERERFKRKRSEEEKDAASSKMARLSRTSEGGGDVARMQDEIKQYRNLLNCTVCHERRKDAVITKCFHLFCGECIQKNIEMRHRKCPGCGVPFGINDVRSIYI